MPKDKSTKKSKAPAEQSQQDLINTLEKSMQIIPIEEFDQERVLYSEPEKKEIPGGKGNYRTVKMRYHHKDGTQGPIIVQLREKWCYGIQPDNLDKDGNVRTDDDGKPQKMKNYQASMPMYDSKTGVTAEDQMEIDFFDGLHSMGKEFAVANKKKIGKGTKNDSTVKDFVKPILFRKKKPEKELENLEEGESPFLDDYCPQLYTKLMYYAKDKKCDTVFYGPGDKELDPRKVEGGFFLIPSVMIDSMYIGDKTITHQHKLYDGTIRFRESRPHKRLAPKNQQPAGNNDGDDNSEDVEKSDNSDEASADMSSASE